MNRRFWISLTLAIISLVLPVLTGQVMARGYNNNGGITVEIISDEGGSLAKYTAGSGSDYIQRSYVIARNDESYRIRIQNRSNERIGLVIAVDGRNIISGRKSYLGSRERMYILGPFEAAEYQGWRTGQNRVNRFYFTGMSDSYAAAWGDYSAMGVIAVAAYKNRYQDMFKHKGNPGKNPLDRPRSNARRQAPGTGFGEAEWSPSRTVQFSPQAKPFTKEFIKYEWRSTLCKRGVIECRPQKKQIRENRFWPDQSPGYGFAPYPPRWRNR